MENEEYQNLATKFCCVICHSAAGSCFVLSVAVFFGGAWHFWRSRIYLSINILYIIIAYSLLGLCGYR